MMMGVVDTIAVGPLGPAAIGAVGTGSGIFFALMVPGLGTLLALDTYVSQSFGAGRITDCHRWLVAGLWLAGALALVLMLVGLGALAALPSLGMHSEVRALLEPYLGQLIWSTLPLLFYTVLRRYLQGMHIVKPVMAAIVAANIVNVLANWVLIYGRFGVPAFGVVGAAWATLASRVILMGVLCWVVVRLERRRPSGLRDVSFAPDLTWMWQLLRHGTPAALQVLLEVGVFAASSVLAARISPQAAGAHQIALQVAGFFFMVPFGLSSAAAVRVGHAVGGGDAAGAARSGWMAIGLSLLVSALVASLLLGAPHLLLGLFSDDVGVVTLGVTVLAICAVFQPFDGVQVVATGALRGMGDTTTPMLLNLAGHWIVGLPVGYVLCFSNGWGVTGLWIGLATGLTSVGVAMLVVWYRRASGRFVLQGATG